jgi:hypothetical protein
MSVSLQLASAEDLADLKQFVGRAKRLDQDGLARLRVFGDVLACYVSPIYSGSLLTEGPTVLGLRTLRLAEPAELDAVLPLSDLLESLEVAGSAVRIGDQRARAAWTGISPPRSDWVCVGELNEAQLTEWAKAGIAEVAAALPGSIGSAIAAKVRLEIWGRALDCEFPLPAATAFAAAGLGFLTENETVGVFQTHGWIRLSSSYGHVLSRVSTRVS